METPAIPTRFFMQRSDMPQRYAIQQVDEDRESITHYI
jgi:hypothetical protein